MKRAVILTALEIEYKAVRHHLSECKEFAHEKGTVYERGVFEDWQILIGETGAGNEKAAIEAERAIGLFAPQVVIFVGVAGGVKDVAIGDVVASSKIYSYESGKAEEIFKPRAEIGLPTYALIERAKADSRKLDWHHRIASPNSSSPPKSFVGPIAAGPKVIASVRSAVCQFLKTQYSDSLAVEMEGYGFLLAAHANQEVDAIVIRGISDLIEKKEESDKAGSQQLASNHASAFAFEVLSKFSPRAVAIATGVPPSHP